MCEWRSVRVRYYKSPHDEAVGSHMRLFHTVSERLYEKSRLIPNPRLTNQPMGPMSIIVRFFATKISRSRSLTAIFHTVSLRVQVNRKAEATKGLPPRR
jgi:hypothetical protein